MTYIIRATYEGKRSEIKKTYATKAAAIKDANYLKKTAKALRKKYGVDFETHTDIIVVKK